MTVAVMYMHEASDLRRSWKEAEADLDLLRRDMEWLRGLLAKALRERDEAEDGCNENADEVYRIAGILRRVREERDTARAELEAARQLHGDLLVHMYSDDGQHVEAVGYEQASRDAEDLWLALLADIECAEAEIGSMVAEHAREIGKAQDELEAARAETARVKQVERAVTRIAGRATATAKRFEAEFNRLSDRSLGHDSHIEAGVWMHGCEACGGLMEEALTKAHTKIAELRKGVIAVCIEAFNSHVEGLRTATTTTTTTARFERMLAEERQLAVAQVEDGLRALLKRSDDGAFWYKGGTLDGVKHEETV